LRLGQILLFGRKGYVMYSHLAQLTLSIYLPTIFRGIHTLMSFLMSCAFMQSSLRSVREWIGHSQCPVSRALSETCSY